MRTKGAKTNKNCWRVLIKQGEHILCDKEYKTLKDGAEDLGLTYSQICELGPNGRCKKKSINFKFMPSINITKISDTNTDTDTIDLIPASVKDIFGSSTQEEAIDKIMNSNFNILNMGK